MKRTKAIIIIIVLIMAESLINQGFQNLPGGGKSLIASAISETAEEREETEMEKTADRQIVNGEEYLLNDSGARVAIAKLSNALSETKPMQIGSATAYNFKSPGTTALQSPFADHMDDYLLRDIDSVAGSLNTYAIVGQLADGTEPIFSVDGSLSVDEKIDTGMLCALQINTDYTDGFELTVGFSSGENWGPSETSVDFQNIWIKKSGLYIFGPEGSIYRKASGKTDMTHAYICYGKHGDSGTVPSELIASIKNGNTTFDISFFRASALSDIIKVAQNNLNSPFDSLSFLGATTYNGQALGTSSVFGDFRKEALWADLKKQSIGTFNQYGVFLKCSEEYWECDKAYNTGDTVDINFDFIITIPESDVNGVYGYVRIISANAVDSWGEGTYSFYKLVFLSPGTHVVHCDNMIAQKNTPIGTKFSNIAFNNDRTDIQYRYSDISIAFTRANVVTDKIRSLQESVNYTGQLFPDRSDPVVYNDSAYATVVVSEDYKTKTITREPGTGITNLGIRFGRIRQDEMPASIAVKITADSDVYCKGLYILQNPTSWGGTRIGKENFTIPEGTSYYVFDGIDVVPEGSYLLDKYLWIHLGEDALSEQNITIGYIMNPPVISAFNLEKTNLSEKTWNAVGDSITDQGKYMDYVHDSNGITVVNCGLASSTIAINNTYLQNQSVVERVCGLNGATAYDDADIWTVMAGLNDVLYKSDLGELTQTGNTFDNTTVYGALQSICENVLGRRAHPRLILMTPTKSVRDDWSKEVYGITIAEIRQAVIDVAEYYSIPVLDTWAVSGINKYNLQRNTNPTTADGVHPTDIGAEMMAVPIAHAIEDQF